MKKKHVKYVPPESCNNCQYLDYDIANPEFNNSHYYFCRKLVNKISSEITEEDMIKFRTARKYTRSDCPLKEKKLEK